MKANENIDDESKEQGVLQRNNLTKEQLLSELDRMHHRVSELETLSDEYLKTEEALIRNEQRFKTLFENAPLGYQCLDKNGRVIEVNDAWLGNMGFSREEVLGRWFGDFIAPDYVDDFRKNFPRFLAHGMISGVELKLVRKDGTLLTVACDGQASYDEDGNFKQTHCIERDITEEKSIQDKILETRQKYETLLKNVPCAVYSTQPTEPGAMFFISDKWQEWTGQSPQDVYRDEFIWEKAIHPDDRDRTSKSFYDALKHKREYVLEYRVVHALNGNEYYLRDHGVPIRDQDRNVIRFDGYITDISDRRKAEEILMKSERNYRTIFNAVNDAICIHDPGTGRIMDVNEKMCEMYGYSRQELLSMDVGQISWNRPPYSQSEALRWLRKASEGSPQLFEWRAKKSNGELFWVEVNLKKADIGGSDRLLALIRDINERKLGEEALLRSEEKWRSITEDSPDIIMILDMEGKIVFVNRTLEGLSKNDTVGCRVYDFSPESDHQAIRECFSRVIKTGKPDGYESNYTGPDGKKYYFRSMVAGIKEGGRITTFIVSSRDLTAQKEAEEEIKRARDKAERYLDMAGNMFLALDAEHNVLMINKRGREILGLPEAEILGKNWINVFVHEADRKETRTTYDQILSGALEKQENREHRLITHNGERRLISWSDSAIKNESGRVIGALSSGRDITETKRLQEELLRTSKLESVGMLAGGIAHDFNNILTAVLGNISLGQKKVHPEDEVYNILKRAERAAIRAKDLTQQLLTFAKGGEPVKRTVDISDLIRESTAFSLRGSNVRCKFSIDKNLWPVDVDEGQFGQVINNLVINAQQAMWEGGLISVRARNLVFRESSGLPLKSGKYIKISIEDRGIGISKDNIRKIFDPYFSTRQNGSGLGLASAFSVVRNHGGHISVQSELGAGTNFDVYLPASDKNVAELAPAEVEEAAIRGRVLVMDDEEMIRDVAGEMLKLLGYEVVFACNGEEAVRNYKAALSSGKLFDAVIVDLTVPGGKGGRETVKMLQGLDPAVKAIVSSGYSNDPIMADFKKYGFSGIVVKPYRLAELREAMNRLLNKC